MPRGSYQRPSKAAKSTSSAPAPTSAPASSGGLSLSAVKPSRTSSIHWKSPTFLSRSSSETKLAASPALSDQPSAKPIQEDSSRPRTMTMESDSGVVVASPISDESKKQPTVTVQAVTEDGETDLTTIQNLAINEPHGGAAPSLYSSDSLSIYSSDDAASVFSSGSSIYSSGASMYSTDEYKLGGVDEEGDSRLPGGLQYQQRAHARQQAAVQDTASRERSTMAKKGAYFKNAKLPPKLPSYNAALPMWSMVCRAAQASQDCYDSEKRTRRGTYVPADTSNNVKAMIIDDQIVDESRFIILAIRGTQLQSLSDWAANMDAKPVKPVGFLDDEENACHAGFLQVAQAMVDRVAAQLKQHPALSERPTLLITGHSAGGAVASLLYSHIISTSVSSDLTALAGQFHSVNCVTFGAPPVTELPPSRSHYDSGEFLAFANEGDPVLRMSNSAYMKSLAKLMTTSQGPVAAPAVKVIRRSRGSAVIRAPVAAVLPPWEERPVWPTPPPSLTNAGHIILLRGEVNSGLATASRISPEDLKDVIFSDLAQHRMEMYIHRVKNTALAAMMGWGS